MKVPWQFIKASCELVEAVINRVSPIQGFREEAFRRSASFNALEVFEEEHDLFPGERDGLDELMSQAPYDSAERREAVGQYTVDEMFAQQARVWDERPDPMELFDRTKAEAKEMAKDTTVPPPYIYRDSAAGAGADPSPAMSPPAGDTSPEGVIPPTPSGPPTHRAAAATAYHGEGPVADSAIPPAPATGQPNSEFAEGYYAAVRVLKSRALADSRWVGLVPDDHPMDPQLLAKCAEYADDLARYMTHIGPK